MVYPEEATEAEVARCSGRASGASWADPHRLAPPARGSSRRQRQGGAGVRPGRHGRLGGTATRTTGDSRRGATMAATGLHGVSGVFFILGRPRRVVAGVAGLLLLLCAAVSSGKRLTKRNEVHQQLPRMQLCLRGDFNRKRITDLYLRVPSSSPSVSRRFGDLHGPGIALPCAQRVAQQFLNFLPLPQGQ